MKNTGVILIGIAAGVVAAVGTYAVLSSVQAGTPQSDEDFVSEVRSGAAGSDTEVKTASLGPAGKTGEVPAIEVETNHYDMGIIPNDKSAEGSVMIHNRGKSPLHITKVNTQCGCTKGKMSKEIIPPGESAPLEVTVDPFRIPQFNSTKTLTLFTNDPDDPTVKIDVTAKVNPELIVDPEKIHLGTIQKGEEVSQTVRLIQNTDQPLSIKSLKLVGQAEYYETDFKEVAPAEWANPDRREYLITAKVLPVAPAGKLRANIMLETEFPRLPRFTIPMELEVKGLYTIEPQVITLRSVQPGQTIEDVLTINGDVPFEVTAINSSNEFLTVSSHEGGTPNSVAFNLAVAQEPDQRWQRDTWMLTINANGQEFKEEVKVMAIIEGAPASTAASIEANPEVAERVRKLREEALERMREQTQTDGAPTGEAPASEPAESAPQP
jgi:hypothetical protein